MLTFVASIVIFGLLVFVHEAGHYLVAKASGVHVYEFALGFGPRLVAWKRRGTIYAIRALPLGGFVKLAGMDEPTEGEKIAPDDPANFQHKPLWQRMLTIAAGPLMNVVLAAFLFAVFFGAVGVTLLQVQKVEPGSPAQQAGLRPGDIITGVNNGYLQALDQVMWTINRNPGHTVRLTVRRGQRELHLRATPRFDPETGAGILGIRLAEELPRRRLSFLGSLRQGVAYDVFMIKVIIHALGRLFLGRGLNELSGPVGVVKAVGQTAKLGFLPLVMLAAVLSVNLGLFNLIPVPILDGGWLAFLFLEGVRGKPLTPAQQGLAQFVGLILILILFLFVTYRDILRLNLG